MRRVLMLLWGMLAGLGPLRWSPKMLGREFLGEEYKLIRNPSDFYFVWLTILALNEIKMWSRPIDVVNSIYMSAKRNFRQVLLLLESYRWRQLWAWGEMRSKPCIY